MSFDPNQTAPVGHATTPKKSGALKWILGGVGCFGLLGLLCLGGVGYMGYLGLQVINSNAGYLEARATIESSAAVGEATGNPVEVGSYTNVANQQGAGGEMSISYDVPVSGPNGTGSAHIEVSGVPYSEDWTVDVLEVEVNGQKVLDGGGLDINIEGE